MKKHDSDDDFLDALYQQSATEQPSAELDETILALAKEHHQQTRFANTMNLQRIVSIAAVMVFTVYIFFEVDKKPSTQIMQEMTPPPLTMHRPSPETERSEPLQRAEPMEDTQALKMQAVKKSAKQAPTEFMADQMKTLSAQEAANLSNTPLSKDEFVSELSENKHGPEDMINEIKQLLASGKISEAQQLVDEFKVTYPEYIIPDNILDELK